jgi:hypothetical protein
MYENQPVTKAAPMYEVGTHVASGDGETSALFVGYGTDGSEWWCDLTDESGGFISPPERKTFVRATPTHIEWEQDLEDFAAAVDHEVEEPKPN